MMKFLNVGMGLVAMLSAAQASAGPPQDWKDGVVFEADHCAPGDPLCVEKIAPPTPTLSGSRKPLPVAPRAHEKTPVAIRPMTVPAVRPAGGTATDPKSLRQSYTEKVSGSGNQEIHFDEDGLSGTARLGGQIKMRPESTAGVPCFDKFWSAFKDPKRDDTSVGREYAAMKTCMDACVTESDAKFLAGCVDWKAYAFLRSEDTDASYFDGLATGEIKLPPMECSTEQLRAGLTSGEYRGTVTRNPGFDEKKGEKRVCTNESAETAREVVRVGEKLAKKFAVARKCPETKADFENLKTYAQALLEVGGKIEALPVLKVGKRLGRACGYSEKHGTFFDRAVYCTDGNTCYDQMRDSYRVDCAKFTRRGPADRYFYAQGEDCSGMRSYHDDQNSSHSRGDLLLMPIGPGVWIQGYRNGMGLRGLNYIGLLFAD